MHILRQSTAVDVLIGPFVDGGDGATTEEALSPSVQLSKNGQTAATKNDATTPAHDNAGYYNCELDATDTNTVGTLVLFVEGSPGTHLQVRHEYQVIEEAVYDMLFAASAVGYITNAPVNVNAWNSVALSTTNPLPNAAAAANGGLPTVNASNHIAGLQGTLNTLDALDTAQDAQHSTTQSSISGLNDLSQAEANAACDTALSDYDGPTMDELVGLLQLVLRSDSAVATDRSALLTLLNADEGSGGGDYANTADSNEAVRDHIGDGTNLTEAGGTGDHLTALATAASIAALNDLSAAEVNAEVVDAIATDTISELGGVPSATPTLQAAIMFLYMALRNRRDTTASDDEVHNDAGSVIATASLTDNGTVFTKGEYA